MKRLSVRLSLALLLSVWIGIGAMALVVQRTLDTGFRQYLSSRETATNPEQIERIENYFATNASWVGVESVLSEHGQGAGQGSGRGASFLVLDLNGMVLAASDASQIGTTLPDEAFVNAQALAVNGVQVAWLYRQSPAVLALGAAEEAFLNDAQFWILLSGFGASLFALAIGSILAWTLARPLRELSVAARDLSVGQLGRKVDLQGTVEIDELATEFNIMSQALAEAEALRQRMAADLAHELRTPVSILRGHLEAMLDGVYPLDSAHLAVAHEQTIHLARLVEDLRVLTLAEAKRLPLERQLIDPIALVKQILDSFEPLTLDANIQLKQTIPPALPKVSADITRIRQVLSNLLSNALRHTPEEGEISVELSELPNAVRFAITNTGSELNEQDAARVFQAFWRGSAARERDGGGSGLGLAISREIIQLHGGAMTLESSDKRVTFIFTLPYL